MSEIRTDFYPALQNLAIMASAGTGKTYSLAMRYIKILLMTGIDPSAISALTFSNKAAGEIFEKIVTRLLEMAESEKKLDQAIYAGYLPPDTTQKKILALLRLILSTRERSGISTIDSFFQQIVQSFPLECGIAGNVSLINEKDDRPRIRALMKSLSSMGEGERREMIEAVKLASYGSDERKLVDIMKKFLKEYHARYTEYPADRSWTCPDQDMAHFLLDRKTLAEYAQKFLRRIQNADKRLQAAFAAFFACAETYGTVRNMADIVKNHIARLFPDIETLDSQKPVAFSYYGKDFSYYGEAAKILREVMRHLIAVEYRYVQGRTRALYRLMSSFDRTYAETARNTGQLTYHDIPILLRRLDYEKKLLLGERIDTRIDHYMLDEFQDTSDVQWGILKDFVDEAIQNEATDRVRSFFFVGDIKQSIYQWRDGNPLLFGQILENYGFSTEEDAPNKLESLSASYRSSLPVIDAVNQVFFESPSSYEEVQEQMENLHFEKHTSAGDAAAQPGCAMLLSLPDSKSREKLVCRLVQELNPFRRKKPLRVGILVRNNKTVLVFAEAFRRFAPELPVTIDGEIKPENSMAFVLYRQLLRHAAHPADQMAEQILKMFAAAENCNLHHRLFGENNTNTLPAAIRDSVNTEGYAGWTARFMKAFPRMSGEDRASMAVLEHFVMTAEPEATLDEFLTSLSLCTGKEASIQYTVQIMTIHKSKGLDFDVVILPDNGTSKDRHNFVESSVDFAVCKDQEWITSMPNTPLIPFFPALSNFKKDADGKACYENCCNLYVAMTRARNALYMITEPLPKEEDNEKKKKVSLRAGNILQDALLENQYDPDALSFVSTITDQDEPAEKHPVLHYVTGNTFWYKEGTVPENEPEAKPETAPERKIEIRRTGTEGCPKKQPAPSQTGHTDGRYRFSGSRTAEFGTAVHNAFADFTFYENPEQLESFLNEPGHQVLRPFFTAHPEIAEALKAPSAYRCILRREQPFQVSLPDGNLLSGCFDRFHLCFNGDGSLCSAEIIDYKTDRVDDPEELCRRHQTQLRLYRTALSILFSIPEERITCKILGLHAGLTVEV